jgi:hypothetical protein
MKGDAVNCRGEVNSEMTSGCHPPGRVTIWGTGDDILAHLLAGVFPTDERGPLIFSPLKKVLPGCASQVVSQLRLGMTVTGLNSAIEGLWPLCIIEGNHVNLSFPDRVADPLGLCWRPQGRGEQIASIQYGTGLNRCSRKNRDMDPDPDTDNGYGKGLLRDECRNRLRTLVIHVLRRLNYGISET